MARLVELLPSIFRIELRNATNTNIYLVREPDGDTLIDAGPVGTASVILALDRKRLIRLRRLVVTHAHPAHAGSAARVSRGTGVDVFVHEADAPYLDGRSPPLLPKGRRGQLIAAIGRFVDLCPPVFRLEPVRDGDAIGSLRVIHTPGHTPGHIALLHPTTGALFCGDVVISDENGTLTTLPSSFDHDPDAAERARQRLQSSGAQHLLPGHGPVVFELAKVKRPVPQFNFGKLVTDAGT